jgi:hypothetical protein
MIDYDLLLTYVSEKGRGSWRELKEAFTWLAGPTDDPAARAWIAARDLAALGHMEIAWDRELMWCAAAPMVTMLPRSGGRAFVTGARTGWLYWPASRNGAAGSESGLLVEVADDLGLWLDTCGEQQGPTTLLVACSHHLQAGELARRLGIAYTYNVADQIAGLLPPLLAYARHFTPGELPRGFEAEYFDPALLEWTATDNTEQRGLYRCRTYEGHVHALHGATGSWHRVMREIAIYEVLRWEEQHVLRYSMASDELTVPAEAALPVLHARAATLSSGRLPRRSFSRTSGTTLTYVNVPYRVAQQIAWALGQRLIEE